MSIATAICSELEALSVAVQYLEVASQAETFFNTADMLIDPTLRLDISHTKHVRPV